MGMNFGIVLNGKLMVNILVYFSKSVFIMILKFVVYVFRFLMILFSLG